MGIPKPQFTVIIMTAIFFILVFLLIRENERAGMAEAQLKRLQYKIDSLVNDKMNVTTDFQNEVDDLNIKLKDAADQYNILMNQKNDELGKLNLQMQEESMNHETVLKEKTEEISATELKSKTELEKLNANLKEKNAEIADLASKLQEISSKLASVLKKKEAEELKNSVSERKIATLERSLKKLKQHHVKLLRIIRNGQEHPAALD